MRTFIAIILLILCAAPNARAQSSPLAVHLESSADDSVGRQLVYEVKEQLRSSNGLSFADIKSESIIRLKLVTLDPDNGVGSRTIYSVVITMRPIDRDQDVYLTNLVGICGGAVVESCARTIVAETDTWAVGIRAALKNLAHPSE